MRCIWYTVDYDEKWPRNDGCITGPSPTKPDTATGCTGPYGQRINHYKWQAWLMPYVKNVDVFKCPSRTLDDTKEGNFKKWTDNGEMYNALALNISATGYIINAGGNGANSYTSNSFMGNGSLAGVKAPSELMIVMELYFPAVPAFYPNNVQQGNETIYPGGESRNVAGVFVLQRRTL